MGRKGGRGDKKKKMEWKEAEEGGAFWRRWEPEARGQAVAHGGREDTLEAAAVTEGWERRSLVLSRRVEE